MIDIKDQRFGKLVAMEFSHLTKSRHAVWKCKCDCGQETIAETRHLRSGTRVSCGCNQYRTGLKNPTWQGEGEISLTHFSKIKVDANKRHKEFRLSLDFLWNLFLKQQRKCALSGEVLHFNSKAHTSDGNASLDRIDSSIGYVEGNVQWVHKDVNFMKSNLTEARFHELVEKIYGYMK